MKIIQKHRSEADLKTLTARAYAVENSSPALTEATRDLGEQNPLPAAEFPAIAVGTPLIVPPRADLTSNPDAAAATQLAASTVLAARRLLPELVTAYARELAVEADRARSVIASIDANQYPFAAAHGIRILDMGWVFGRRHLTTTKTPVTTPGDMAGLKIRVQPTKIYLATIQAMGGTPTPMDFKEVYTSLQTGVIDGQENPVNVLATRKFYEVQGYLMLTGHITQNQALVVGEQVHRSLSPEQQALLVQAARDAGDDQNGLLAKSEEADLALLSGNGMKIVAPDVAAFQAATADVHLAFDEQWGAGFFERLKSVQ